MKAGHVRRGGEVGVKKLWKRWEPEWFGVAFDVLYVMTAGIALWMFLVTVYFNRYQSRAADFRPLRYSSVIALILLLYLLRSHFRNVWMLTAAELLVLAAYCRWLPILGTRVPLVIVAALIFFGSLFEYSRQQSASQRYSIRYRKCRYGFLFGAGILACLLFQASTSAQDLGLSVSPMYCRRFLLVGFGLFLVLYIMQQFAFEGFHYYRKRMSADRSTRRQYWRSAWLMFAVLSIVIMLMLAVFAGPAAAGLSYAIYGGLSLALRVWFALFPPGGMLSEKPEQSAVLEDLQERMQGVEQSFLGTALNYVLFVVLLIVVCLLFIWLYRHLLASYRTEKDVVEYIPDKKEQKLTIQRSGRQRRRNYGDSAREKIRGYFYQTVLTRTRKKHMKKNLRSCTPDELTGRLSQGEADRRRFEKLAGMYSRARYSDEECTEQDVLDAQQLSEELDKNLV